MATAAKEESGAPGPTTVEELLAWPNAPAGEIVDGVWVPRDRDGVTGARLPHGLVASEIDFLLRGYGKAQRAGRSVTEISFLLRRRPDLTRCPDVAFLTAARLVDGFTNGIFEGAPDLAVEVLSPSNTPSDVRRKVDDYLRYGSRLVWVVDSTARSVVVHTRGGLPRTLRSADVLDGGDVLPGFSAVTSAVFADLDEFGPAT